MGTSLFLFPGGGKEKMLCFDLFRGKKKGKNPEEALELPEEKRIGRRAEKEKRGQRKGKSLDCVGGEGEKKADKSKTSGAE